MFSQFQVRYPTSSLISEFVSIEGGKYIVRAMVLIEGVTRATGLAAADTIELAEDRARKRALEVLGIRSLTPPQPDLVEPSISSGEALKPPHPYSASEPAFSPEPFEPLKFDRISTDTSWLEDTSPLPETPTVSVMPSAEPVGVAAEFSPDWQRHTWVEDETAELMPTFEAEKETTISSSSSSKSKKVTPIRSRRQNAVKTEIQPLPSDAEAQAQEEFEVPTEASDPVDLSDLLARIASELKRLGWTDDQRNKFLERTYKKQSLSLLNKTEMLELVQYLECFAKIDVELKRIGWTQEKGKGHLLQTYGKGSRSQLTPKQLAEFLEHLELQPDPIS